MFKHAQKTKPYVISAEIYDYLMSHVEYQEWAEYIHDLFLKFAIPGKKIVEAGCGTGTLLNFLNQMQYRVSGFDLSFEMVREAKRKYNAIVWQGDLRSFSLKNKFDAFLCLYDSIQYLELDDFPTLLKRVYHSLNNKGLFIFDIVTETHILTYWKYLVDKDETDHYRLNRKSWYDPRKKIQHTEIECYDFISKNAYIEHHHQHVFDLDELIPILIDSDFKFEGMFGDFTLNEAHSKSDRIHFVLKKEVI